MYAQSDNDFHVAEIKLFIFDVAMNSDIFYLIKANK